MGWNDLKTAPLWLRSKRNILFGGHIHIFANFLSFYQKTIYLYWHFFSDRALKRRGKIWKNASKNFDSENLSPVWSFFCPMYMNIFGRIKVILMFFGDWLKLINVQYGIRPYRWENFPKINKRTCTSIPDSRVLTLKVKASQTKFASNLCWVAFWENLTCTKI